MAQEADFTRPQNNLASNQCNMLLEIEKIRKGLLGPYGFLE